MNLVILYRDDYKELGPWEDLMKSLRVPQEKHEDVAEIHLMYDHVEIYDSESEVIE